MKLFLTAAFALGVIIAYAAYADAMNQSDEAITVDPSVPTPPPEVPTSPEFQPFGMPFSSQRSDPDKPVRCLVVLPQDPTQPEAKPQVATVYVMNFPTGGSKLAVRCVAVQGESPT